MTNSHLHEQSSASKSEALEIHEFTQDDPKKRGQAHGELWREEIRELASIRSELALKKGQFVNLEQLLAIADLHLPVLQQFSEPLYEELVGIAEGAGISNAQVVVLNHYTDLRDVPVSVLQETSFESLTEDPGGCTALYVQGNEGPILAQTWDMHGTAFPFVRLLRIRPQHSDWEQLCFTITGCLGMTGMNRHGLGITINNLTSTDAQVGVVWPALVRKMLLEKNAAAAKNLLFQTTLSSGHHYMLADPADFYGVETSGKLKAVTQRGAKASHLHTNHCFDPKLRQVEKVPAASTTYRRFELATMLMVDKKPQTVKDIWQFLSSHEGYPRSICSHVDDATGDPSASRTCGLVVMDLVKGRMLACRGCGQEHSPQVFQVERFAQ